MTVLNIAPTLSLPLDAITETFALLAVRRAGKSNAAVVMAEEMYDNGLPWVAIDPKGDWWGIRAAGEDGTEPGLSVLVFGGLHGDVPLEPTAGRMVADLIVEKRLTCVLDVSEMSTPEMHRFLIDFAVRLYQQNREPLHLFCEEADEYIPQMVQGGGLLPKVVGAFEKLIKRGGFRGIGVTLITQRSASLNKHVLTQVGTLIPMRTPSPQDRKAILAWVDMHDSGKEAVNDLPKLENGEAYVFSPQWLGVLTKIRFRRRRTFDSGATPKVGQKPRQPATLAEVDLASIKEAMSDTIEKAELDDPKVLRRRIDNLLKENGRLQDAAPETVVERVEVPAIDEDGLQVLRDFGVAAEKAGVLLAATLERLGHVPDPGRQLATTPLPRFGSTTTEHIATGPPVLPKPPRPAPRPSSTGTGVSLPGPQRKILTALAQHGAKEKTSLAILTGYSHKGGGFNNPLGSLRAAGYISPAGVTPIEITDEGLDALGDYEPLPTGRALLEWWMPQLTGPERKIVTALDQYGPMEKVVLAAATGYEPKGGGFNNPMGHLRTLRVITAAGVSPIGLAPEMTGEGE